MPKLAGFILSLIILTAFSFCKINRTKNGLRTGLWVTESDTTGEGFRSRGRYKKDKEKGVWKYFYNDTLYQKDRYSGYSARVRFYYPNKKIQASGKTRMDYNGKLLHWFYNGDWKYFDAQGNLLKIVTYEKGNPIAEVLNKTGIPKMLNE
jgi:antitoxin component YwqK of YwqJK toxin-antitoxin module